MTSKPLSSLARRRKKRSGQTLVEYALVLVMMVIYLQAVLYGVTLPNGTRISGLYQVTIWVFDRVNKVIYAPYGGDYDNVYE